MKQALLITAYKNIEHLFRIIAHFDNEYCFYIHIDKNSRINAVDLQKLENTKKVHYLSKHHTTHWGGAAHLYCILDLMQKALQNKENEYLHLISGHDFPIQSTAYFSEFLDKNKGKEFIEVFSMPAKVWENGGMDRLKYYHLNDFINAKGKWGAWLHRFIKLQKKLGFTRNINFKGMALYGGSTWWSLSRECCDYIVAFLKDNPWFLNKFRFSFCAEEMLIQTIVMNSPFKNKIGESNLRLIVWELRHGNIPAILDETDFERICTSKHLFARRFEFPESENLLNKLLLG